VASSINKIISFVLISCLLAASAWAETPISEEPETKVQISIYDLVKKGSSPRISKLDPGYIKKIIQLLETNQSTLLKCLPDKMEKDLKMKLSIFPSGKAYVQSLNALAQDCEKVFFQNLTYPRHSYAKDVTLELDLNIRRDIL
jgi:hypothetical protein